MANPLKLLSLKVTSYQFIQEVKIDASVKESWKALLNVGKWWPFHSSEKRPKTLLEAWPGGRFHSEAPEAMSLYATVTHIEPNKLLRMSGNMGTSHLPVMNAFIFELQPRKGGGTLLRFCQRGFGYVTKDHAKSYQGGWREIWPHLKKLAETSRK